MLRSPPQPMWDLTVYLSSIMNHLRQNDYVRVLYFKLSNHPTQLSEFDCFIVGPTFIQVTTICCAFQWQG